jgi:hypothetical protein
MTSDGCFDREGEAGTAPASSKDISATGQPAAMADAFKNMGESLDLAASGATIICVASKSR